MKVIKRNGEVESFIKEKIENAIAKAGNVKPSIRKRIAYEIASLDRESITVEEIQDLVENKLMASSYKSVAREYVRYRYKRELIRNSNTSYDAILELVSLKNEELNKENSNKNPTVISTQRDYMAGEASKDITFKLLLPDDVVEAHNNGIIHFHDSDYFAQHSFNCFAGRVKFLTDKGILAFKECSDGDVVKVRCKDGVYRKATVHKYGYVDSFNEVTLKTSNRECKVRCTTDHRWILEDGSITTNLSVGDVLFPLVEDISYDLDTWEKRWAFCLGFIIGDGNDTSKGTRVTLCGDKIKYKDIFLSVGFREHKPINDYVEYVTYSTQLKQDFLNSRSWKYMNIEDKKYLFHGYYAADGGKRGTRIWTSDLRVCEMIEDISHIAGYVISSKSEKIESTNFKEDRVLYSYHFVTNQNYYNTRWKVLNIEKVRGGMQWCVEEPETHSFTLDGGVVTGNCCLVNLEDMLQNGTVINNTLIEKPHSFSTACNIATQIMAQIASNQYGGQSHSLSHLAPFVDISRKKLRKEVKEELLSFKPYKVLAKTMPKVFEKTVNDIAEKRVKDEVRRGVQTIQYQINTLMTCNGQTPFVTLFMYLNEVPEGQERDDLAMIIEEVVKQRYEGTKNEVGVWVTPAFPKLIYVLEENNIREDSKYWYLTKLCAKCTAKRLVPDYVSEKKMLEYKVDDNGEGHCYPPMGCRSFLTPYIDEVFITPEEDFKI